MLRAKGEQLDEFGGGKVRLHQLAVPGEREGCLQLPIDFCEKERTLGSRPVVQGCEPLDCLFVLCPRRSQRYCSAGPRATSNTEAELAAAPEKSRKHSCQQLATAAGLCKLVLCVTVIRESFRWAGVELRHLLALRAVAEEGSVAAAARQLGYSQPAVSQQLATLERLLKAQLVERQMGARRASLTEAGRLVLGHGAAILARAQAADGDLRQLESGTAGTLRLGVFPSVGARVVPPLLQRVATQWPDIDVQLVEDASDRRLLDQVEAAELDLAFAMLPLRDGPFASAELLRDPYVILIAAGSELAASKPTLTPREIARLPLIGFRHTQAYPQAFLRANGIDVRIRFRTDDNETLVGLVAAGMGAALVPRLTVDPMRTDVAQLEIAGRLPPRLIALAWHRDREQNQTAEAVVKIARRLCAGL